MKPEVTSRDTELRKMEVVDFVVKSLLTMWFVGKTPKDLQKWEEIARIDATGIVNSLADAGLLNLETRD